MINKQATPPVISYTGRSQDMPPPLHWYNTRTQQKANVIIQQTNSHQPNIHLQTCNAVINPSTGAAMEYRNIINDPTKKVVWTRSMANEFGRYSED